MIIPNDGKAKNKKYSKINGREINDNRVVRRDENKPVEQNCGRTMQNLKFY
jgi:hypothetical protein